jgi:hypothetical protein
VFGWLVFVVPLLFVVLVVLVSGKTGALGGLITMVAIVSVLSWFIRLVGICSRIEVSDEGLVVVSWLTRWDIPWSAVESVAAPNDLVIALVGGREVAPSVGGGSLISALMNNSTQRRMVAAIAARRPAVAPVTGSAVRRRLDVHPWGFLVLLTVFVAIAVAVHQFG